MARSPRIREIEEDEALPEADRLEGFPHPRETVRLVGHERAETAMAEAFAGGRMHHGWLVTGPEGIGKATLAYRIARHVLAKPEERRGGTLEVAETTAAARQVLALSHPGLLVIRRPYDPKTKRLAASIPVDEVRRLRSFLGHTAGEGSWRVVIVDRSEEMNASSANALLKSLEEPPPRAVFLLITSEPGRLIATIRSRCRTLELAPLPSERLREAALAALAAGGKKEPAAGEWPKLTRLAEGSVRKLLVLADTGGLELYEKAVALLGNLPGVDWNAVHNLADELAGVQNEQRFETFFGLLLDLLGRLIRGRAGVAGIAEDEQRLSERLIGDGSLATWAGLWETVVREKATALAINLDRKNLVLETVIRLEAAARR